MDAICDYKTELCSIVRHVLKQRQNTGIADIIGIADDVSLKYRYNFWLKTDIQMPITMNHAYWNTWTVKVTSLQEGPQDNAYLDMHRLVVRK